MTGQDFERAASMIVDNIVSMLSLQEVPLLLDWIEKLPEPIVHNYPWIDVYHANTLALSGQLEQVDSLLERVERRVKLDAPGALELYGHVAAIRAAANLRGNPIRVIEMAALLHKDSDLHARYIEVRRRGYDGFAELIEAFANVGVLNRPKTPQEQIELTELCWIISEQWPVNLEMSGETLDEAGIKKGVALMWHILRPYLA